MSSKPSNRKCANCRFYQTSPLWRKGWCRNPLLYDPQTNHLVEADSLSCSRTFIDYWEPRETRRPGKQEPVDLEHPLVRRAPSIPLTPTGPGGAPLRNTGVVAAAQAANLPRDRPPQLSLVRPSSASPEPPVPADRLPLAHLMPPVEVSEPGPVAAPAAAVALTSAPARPPAARLPAWMEDDRRRVAVLSAALIVALAVAVLALRPPAPRAAGPNALPFAPVAIPALVPTDTTRPATPNKPSPVPTFAPPTPAPLVLAVNAFVQITGLDGAALRVRQTPGLKGRVLGALRDGVRAQIKAGPQTADSVAWWQITGWDKKGTLGWVSGKYLKPVR